MRTSLVLLLALALLAGGFVWYASAAGNHQTVWGMKLFGDDTRRFSTATVERGDIVATISATGTVEPEEVVDVGAQVAGMIKVFGRDPRDPTKSIDYGSPVEEGTVLAQIDDSIYKAQVDQAKANLERAEAELLQAQTTLRLSQRNWERAQSLRARNAMSDADYDKAEADYETAKSALAAAEAAVAQNKANLGLAEINLAYTTIKSPVKGVIVDRRVNAGQTVVASLNAPSLFLIAKDLKRMQVWASVNEADIGNIHPRDPEHSGQVVRFTVDAYPDEVFQGEVAQIRLNATMTQNVVTYTVVVETDNSSGKLLPYLTANLKFEIDRRSDILLVPNAALRWRPQRDDQGAENTKSSAQAPQQRSAKSSGQQGKGQPARRDRGTLWREDDDSLQPFEVQTGLSDGAVTEIVSGDVHEGMAVVTGEARRNQSGGTTNPFTPKVFGGNRPQQ